jgi:hypothetical protein
MDGWSAPYCFEMFFSQFFFGWIDLKFGGDLQVDLLFFLLTFFLLSSTSNSPFYPSTFSYQNLYLFVLTDLTGRKYVKNIFVYSNKRLG